MLWKIYMELNRMRPSAKVMERALRIARVVPLVLFQQD
jgi:hypothetical protein